MRLSATKKVNTENICWALCPLMFFSRILPIKSPMRDPIANGPAIDVFKIPVASEIDAAPADTIAKTPSEVATIAFMGKSVNFISDGTMMNPPPTPKSPDKNPALAPASMRDLAHGTVQINLPMDKSNRQGGALAIGGVLPDRDCVA